MNMGRPKPESKQKRQQSEGSKKAVKHGSEKLTTSSETSGLWDSCMWLIVATSLMAVLVATYVATNWENGEDMNSVATGSMYTITENVLVKVLPSTSAKFSQSCVQAGVPVVLRNSIVKQWKAKNWTPKYLKSKLKTLTGVYENNNRWFGPYFDKQKPLLKTAVRINKYRTDLHLSSKEFFNLLQNPRKNQHLYFTGDIDQLGEWAFDEIQPIDELLVLNPKRSSINAWIGQPHVIAHCHYDGYHNFYAQLYGTKKFTLFKPSNWPGLYPYPFLHPSHAQAQINLSNHDELERFPLVSRIEAVEVVLEPGDLLYMPPLWFHRVEALDVSISVNVWTDSKQTELMERIFHLPLPFDMMQFSNSRVKIMTACLLIYNMLQNICKYQDCVNVYSDKFVEKDLSMETPKWTDKALYFVYRLWTTRYRYLMEAGQLPNQLEGGKELLCESQTKDTNFQEALSKSNTAQFEVHAEQVGQLSRGLPAVTWDLWLGNYVEYIAANAVPEVEYVGLFLKHFSSCIAHSI